LADLAEGQRKPVRYLAELEQKKRSFFQNLDKMRRQLSAQLQLEIRQILRWMAQEVPGWVEEVEPEHVLSRMTTAPGHYQVDQLVEKICDKVYTRIKEEIQQWEGQTLGPLLGDWLSKAEADLGMKRQSFYAQLGEIQGGSSRFVAMELEPAAEIRQTALQGVAVCFSQTIYLYRLLHGVADRYSGLKRIMSPRRLEQEVKKEVGQSLKEKLEEDADRSAVEVAVQIDKKLDSLKAGIRKNLSADLEPIQRQVEEILRDKRLSEARLQERQRFLQEIITETAEAQTALREVLSAITEV
jgi:hypothetical protein